MRTLPPMTLILALAATACGGNSKLSPEQKTKVSTVVSAAGSAGRVNQTVATNGGKGGGRQLRQGHSLEAFMMTVMPGEVARRAYGLDADDRPGLENDEDVSPNESYQLMEYSIAKNCEFDASEPTERGIFGNLGPQKTEQTLEVRMAVFGKDCPVEFKAGVKVDIKQNKKSGRVNGDLLVDYQVKDAEFKKLNDVTGLRIAANFDIEAKSETEGRLSIGMDGFVDSQTEGPVTLKATGEASANKNGGKGNVVVSMQFTDFTAEIEMRIRKDGPSLAQEYYLNGERVTEQELKELFGDGAGYMTEVPGIDQGRKKPPTNRRGDIEIDRL